MLQTKVLTMVTICSAFGQLVPGFLPVTMDIRIAKKGVQVNAFVDNINLTESIYCGVKLTL